MPSLLRLLLITLTPLAVLFLAVSFDTIQAVKPVWAAEDEESEKEYEDEEEDEDDDDEKEVKNTPSSETITRTYTVMEKVTETVVVTPAEFLSDRDNDALVDAIDPNPDVHQREYFTDDDGDSVANARDRFPGKDDFATFEFELDDNANGIIDSYES